MIRFGHINVVPSDNWFYCTPPHPVVMFLLLHVISNCCSSPSLILFAAELKTKTFKVFYKKVELSQSTHLDHNLPQGKQGMYLTGPSETRDVIMPCLPKGFPESPTFQMFFCLPSVCWWGVRVWDEGVVTRQLCFVKTWQHGSFSAFRATTTPHLTHTRLQNSQNPPTPSAQMW